MIERTDIFVCNVKSYVAAGMLVSLVGILGECTATYGAELVHFIHHMV